MIIFSVSNTVFVSEIFALLVEFVVAVTVSGALQLPFPVRCRYQYVTVTVTVTAMAFFTVSNTASVTIIIAVTDPLRLPIPFPFRFRYSHLHLHRCSCRCDAPRGRDSRRNPSHMPPRRMPLQGKSPPRFDCISIGDFALAGGVLSVLLSLGPRARTACHREPRAVHQRRHEPRGRQSTGAIRTEASTTARDEEIRTLPHLQARHVFFPLCGCRALNPGNGMLLSFVFLSSLETKDVSSSSTAKTWE